MTVVQMHQTVTGHDAIGNDIEAIFKLLNAQGRRCVVFANNTLNKQVTYIEESELDSVLQEEDNIILYVPSIIRRAEEDTPGTTVPMASRRPEINSIIISKIFPFNI